MNIVTWGYSSVGRALDWQSRGQGFKSPYLHQIRREVKPLFFESEILGFINMLSYYKMPLSYNVKGS